MCDPYGDSETNGLLLDTTVIVSDSGKIVTDKDKNSREVKGVYECVGCSIKEMLPFIGHDRDTIGKYIVNDNCIPFNAELVNLFNKLPARPPGAFLVKELNQLFGVQIDDQNNAIIVGIVTAVVPYHKEGSQQNAVLIRENGQIELTNTRTINLNEFVTEGNAKIGIVSMDGYLLVKSDPNINELILILQHGYFVLENREIVWTRKSVDPMANTVNPNNTSRVQCRHTTLKTGEIFVSNSGLIVKQKESEVRSLIGSHNAIVNFNAFKQSIRCMADSPKNEINF